MKQKATKKETSEFLYRISDTNAVMQPAANVKGQNIHRHTFSEPFMITESWVKSNSDIQSTWNNDLVDGGFERSHMNIRTTEFVNRSGVTMKESKQYAFPLKGADPYVAETALFLGMHPANLAMKPASAHEYLQGFGASKKDMGVYQDLGMSTEETARCIRQLHETAEAGQSDAQAASDFLSSLDGDLFSEDRGMSL